MPKRRQVNLDAIFNDGIWNEVSTQPGTGVTPGCPESIVLCSPKCVYFASHGTKIMRRKSGQHKTFNEGVCIFGERVEVFGNSSSCPHEGGPFFRKER